MRQRHYMKTRDFRHTKGGQNLEKKNNSKLSEIGKKVSKSYEKATRKPPEKKASSFAEYEAMMNERKRLKRKNPKKRRNRQKNHRRKP